MFKLTVDPMKAPDEPEYVEIEFERDDAVAVNGERLEPLSCSVYSTRSQGGMAWGVSTLWRIDSSA